MGQQVPCEAKIIGATLKRLRKAAGLSLMDIARALEVSYQQVQKYETGNNRFPLEKLHQLKEFYNIDYDVFFAGLSGGGPLLCSEEAQGIVSYGMKLNMMSDKALQAKLLKALDIFLFD